MAFEWSLLGILPLVSMAASWLLAAIVFLARPEILQNRRLALVLLMEGVFVGCAGGMLVTDAPGESRAFRLVNAVAALSLPPLYLLFISTFRTPLVRPLTHQAIQHGLLVLAFGLPLLVIARPALFTGEVVPTWFASWFPAPGPLSEPMFQVVGAAYAIGLIAAISTFRRAPKASKERQRLRFFLVAFIVRDSIMAILLLAYPIHLHFFPEISHVVYLQTPSIGQLAFAVLITRGILSVHLFDVEIRLAVGLRVALSAVFLLGVPVVAAAALLGLGADLGAAALTLLLGGLAALVMWRPVAGRIETLSRRVVRDSSRGETEAKRRDAYRAALESIYGMPTSRSVVRMLAELRKTLWLTERDHEDLASSVRENRLEHEVRRRQRFRIERPLGSGGHARALLAWDRDLNRRVVLKEFGGSQARTRAQALAEARTAARLVHPNVVTVHEVLRNADPPLIVFEYLPGGSLQDLLNRHRKLPLARSLDVAADVLRGLQRIHAERFVHCDVKPANVLFTEDGHAKLADFGIARRLLAAPTSRAGTIGFTAPDILNGLPPDPRADLYSVGALIRVCLTGEELGTGAEKTVSYYNGVAGLAREASETEVPTVVRSIVKKALAKSPSDRYGSASEMLAAVEAANVPRRLATPKASTLSIRARTVRGH